jgi:hypothetical protein
MALWAINKLRFANLYNISAPLIFTRSYLVTQNFP